ncbi:MAG: SH3 domain-containing protein [Caldilineales bacterium]|nr:SH3 domain-containing protein [Caldilineales bacterium]
MQQSSFLSGFGRLLESRNIGRILGFIIIPILVILILLLPPIQLVERIQNIGHQQITAESGVVSDPDGTPVIFPADGLPATGSTYARIESVPRADFERGETSEDLRHAAEVLPGNLRPRSPIYELNVQGNPPEHSVTTIPIPNDSLPYETLDVYNWTGDSWQWMPRNIVYEEDAIQSDSAMIPASFMVVQTSPTLPRVGVIQPPTTMFPPEAVAGTTSLYPSVLLLRGDGGVDGAELLPSAEGVPYGSMLTVRNYEQDGVPRTDLLANLMIDPVMQEIQINTLAELAATKLYDGVALDYRGVDPPLREEFSNFVSKLADRLHQDGKRLVVFVDEPAHIAEGQWETYGYDWLKLGQIADGIVIPGPDNPLAYAPGGEVEEMLAWAVGQIDRQKLQLSLPARSVEQADNYFIFRGYGEALAPLLGQVALNNDVIPPGESVQAALQSNIVASPLQFDPATGISWYRYRGQGGEERIVFLEDADSLAVKLALANRFNLGGVVVESLLSDDIDAKTWDVLASYASGQSPALSDEQLSLAWKLTDPQGNVVATQNSPLNQAVALAVPDAPGTYNVQAELMEGSRSVGNQGSVPIAVATYTPVPTPTPEFTPTPEASPTPEFTPTPTPPPFAVAVATGTTNLRGGPGTNYPVVGSLPEGAQMKIIGKNQNGTWWQLERDNGDPAWIIANRVNAQGPANEIAVAANIPEAPAQSAAPAASSGGGGQPRPAGAGNFGYGMQIQPYGGADIAFAANAIKGAGFNWVKWQVPWKDLEGGPGQIGWGGQDGLINFFNGQGLQVLASIVKAPDWARPGNTDRGVEGPPADPQTFANFLGAFAGRYCGKVQAIEVWNEQNLHYEWGNEPLDPARYMELLKRAYRSIKAACPQMIVVSGALTPAGNVGALAIDDFQYLEAMYRNGLKDFSDAIGAHPSGYNVPPSINTTGAACDFINQTNSSFRGPCDSPHHSWSARMTMEGYRNIMAKYGDTNKRIWPTEFGWAAGGALHPSYGYANDNTYDEQARWTVEFYQWMKNNGYTGPAFLWNLNFGITNPGTELAQWGIWGKPTYDALKNMPK